MRFAPAWRPAFVRRALTLAFAATLTATLISTPVARAQQYTQPAYDDDDDGGYSGNMFSGVELLLPGLAAIIPFGLAVPTSGVLIYDRIARPEERPNKVAAGFAITGGMLLLGIAGLQCATYPISDYPGGVVAATVGYAAFGTLGFAMGVDALVRADAWDAAHPAGTETAPADPSVTPDAPPPATSFKLPPPKFSIAPVMSAQQQGLALVIAGW